MTTDTMRRVRSYKRGTQARADSRAFQARMLVHLVQTTTRRIRIARQNKES